MLRNSLSRSVRLFSSGPSPPILFVKKILADGSACKKCNDVTRLLEKEGHMSKITRTVFADERDPDCEGVQLANRFNVTTAPFFVVGDVERNDAKVYKFYFQLKKEVFGISNKDQEHDEVAQKTARDIF